MPFKFTPNKAGITEVATGPKVRAHVVAQADRVARTVRSTAPARTGAYRRSITRSDVAEVNGDKVSALVGSNDPFWHLVEFGSVHNPAHHPLENGVRRAGFEFQQGGNR